MLELAANVRRKELALLTDKEAIIHEHVRLAEIYDTLGDAEQAALHATRALELDPEDSSTRERLDRALQRLGHHAERVEVWTAVANADRPAPVRVAALLRAADISERHLKRRDEALAILRAAWAIEPGNSSVFDALSALLTPDALAVEEDPRGVQARLDLYTQAASATEDPTRKIGLLEKLVSIWEDELAQPARAVEEIEKILEIDPERRAAILALQRNAARAGDAQRLARAPAPRPSSRAARASSAGSSCAPPTSPSSGSAIATGPVAGRPRARDRSGRPRRAARARPPRRARRPVRGGAARAAQAHPARPRGGRGVQPLDRGRGARRAAPQAAAQRRGVVPRGGAEEARSPAAADRDRAAPPRDRQLREARRGPQLARRRGAAARRPRAAALPGGRGAGARPRARSGRPPPPRPRRRGARLGPARSGDPRRDGAHLRPRRRRRRRRRPRRARRAAARDRRPRVQPAGDVRLHDRERARGLYARWLERKPPALVDHALRISLALVLAESSPRQAVEILEGLVGVVPNHIPALRMLEQLYRHLEAPTSLATVLRAEADVFTSSTARGGALGRSRRSRSSSGRAPRSRRSRAS